MMLWLAGLAFAEDCSMYNSMGAAIHWYHAPLYFGINPTNSEGLEESQVVEAITEAAAAWEGHPNTELGFEYQGLGMTREGNWEDQNTIFWASEWTSDSHLLASTLVWSDDAGSAVAFDITINGPNYEWGVDGESGKIDIQNALAHEFGHVLGIAHLADSEATMFDSAVRGEVLKRDIHDADISCIQELYPVSTTTETDFQYPLACSSSPQAPYLLAFGILFFLRSRKESS
jgi:predicted Zn-dependent protease